MVVFEDLASPQSEFFFFNVPTKLLLLERNWGCFLKLLLVTTSQDRALLLDWCFLHQFFKFFIKKYLLLKNPIKS
jgi:hypothetical protein